ncbi:GL16498 [Drosophila persimilis]|uniref:GL16498 n=1 Tax=Drosophila persimilis TaxID=7234 RepID=B4GW82_DROPE|nr:GL16498 [Drosophila persimilis]
MAALSNLKQCPPFFALADPSFGANHIPELDNYPRIHVKGELHNSSAQRFYGGQGFVPVHEGVLKRIIRTFFEGGFWDSLAETRSEKTREQAPWLGKTGDYISQLLGIATTLKLKVLPHTHDLSAERIAQYVETRDWIDSDSTTQTLITCIAWRPLSVTEIVIGCRQGLCFWIVDNTMILGRTNSPSQFFKHPENLPITSMQWNKLGNLLATASIGDRSIIIWQPDSGLMEPLKRLGPPGSLLKWSPGNDWLFAGTVDRVFRVWNCHNHWTTERWTCGNGGHVQTACWSPCGRFLLFVSTTEPILYRLQFVQQTLLKSTKDEKEVLPIADLNACSADENRSLIGGPVQQLAWDPRGNYLVITFKSTNHIAVFRTFITKYDLQISPAYYLSGEIAAEHPSFVCFQPLYKEDERSIVTIAWSSGRIQYYAFD